MTSIGRCCETSLRVLNGGIRCSGERMRRGVGMPWLLWRRADHLKKLRGPRCSDLAVGLDPSRRTWRGKSMSSPLGLRTQKTVYEKWLDWSRRGLRYDDRRH